MTPDTEIFETKLTRTEVLDLILDDLTEEFNQQIAPLRKRLAELRKVTPSPEDFLRLMPKNPTLNLQADWHEKGRFWVKVAFHIKESQIPKSWTAHEAEVERISQDLSELEEKKRRLTENRRRAQNEIIRRSLEASAGGRKVPEAVGGFKLALKKKLLTAGAP